MSLFPFFRFREDQDRIYSFMLKTFRFNTKWPRGNIKEELPLWKKKAVNEVVNYKKEQFSSSEKLSSLVNWNWNLEQTRYMGQQSSLPVLHLQTTGDCLLFAQWPPHTSFNSAHVYRVCFIHLLWFREQRVLYELVSYSEFSV